MLHYFDDVKYQSQYFISCVMAFALHLISFEIFQQLLCVSQMCPIFGFVNTWISQSESFADNVQVCRGRRQTEECFSDRTYVWRSLQWQQAKKGMIVFFSSHCMSHRINRILCNSQINSLMVQYMQFLTFICSFSILCNNLSS